MSLPFNRLGPGAAANSLLCVNLTQSQALAAPPYNFSAASVGFANFALIGGALLALAIAGPLSDWIAKRSTNKNGGTREPEMRLPTLIPFIVIAAAGLTVSPCSTFWLDIHANDSVQIVGVGYQFGWPWEVVIILGFGMVGILCVGIPTICITVRINHNWYIRRPC